MILCLAAAHASVFNKPHQAFFWLTILTGKNCFTQFSAIMAASDLFHMFTESIKFYIFHYHILRVNMFEKCDSSNRQ